MTETLAHRYSSESIRRELSNEDIYGNKDPVAATKAMQMADRTIKALEELSEECREFYIRRMVTRIQTKIFKKT